MTALRTLEQFVPFTPEDRLITIGDYVDRGPDSRSVLDWLIDRKSSGRLVALRGNHELMMCAARQSPSHYDEWIACGGDTALASYGGIQNVPPSHWQFMEKTCRPYFETATHFFVHANAYPDVPLDEQPDFMLYWEPLHDAAPHQSGKIMVCGHTPQRTGRPLNLGHAVCIDTWAHGGGALTCLDVQTGRYWQAAQDGRTSSGFLDS
jgi:serine/threonine protein phosphatase 1